MTTMPDSWGCAVTRCHSNKTWTNRAGSRERWTEKSSVKAVRGGEGEEEGEYVELNLLCLLGGFPGRKKLFSGWCGGVSEHLLSLPFWVSGINDWNWFSSNSTFLNLKFTPTFLDFGRLSEERYPKLAAYYNRLKERPSIKATWPPTWVENPQSQDLLKDLWDTNTKTVPVICNHSLHCTNLAISIIIHNAWSKLFFVL